MIYSQIKKATEPFDSSWVQLSEKIMNWGDKFIINIPNIIIAALVFFLFYGLSRIVNNKIDKYLANRIEKPSVRDILTRFISFIILVLGLLLALTVLDLDQMLTSLFAGAGIAGLAIGIALKSTLSNTFSGIYMAVKDIIKKDDFVETNGYMGTVEQISIRFLKLRATDNNVVIIPNRQVLEKPFKNYSLSERIRVSIKCGVSYDSDLEKVRELSLKTIKDNFPQFEDTSPEFHYLDFGDSSINFHVRYWVKAKTSGAALIAKSDGIMAIKKAFDKEGITIPFPITSVILNN